MRTIEKAVVLAVILTMLFSITNFKSQCEGINQKVFRLHILANSNTDEDQNLKLKVRDRILEYSKEYLDSAKNKTDAETLSLDNLEKIKNVAQDEIKKCGYNYPVTVNLCNMYFNTRRYEDITLPAGKYDALRVVIGQGDGHNWWCVMFPPICLGAAKSESGMDDILNEEELEIVENVDKYEIKFKVVEWFETFTNWFCNLWG